MWSPRVSGDIPKGRPGSHHGGKGLPLLPHSQEGELQPGGTPGQQSGQGRRGRASTWTSLGPSVCLSVSISYSLGSLPVSLSLCFHLSLCVFFSLSLSHTVSVSLSPSLCLGFSVSLSLLLCDSSVSRLHCPCFSSSRPENSCLLAPASLSCLLQGSQTVHLLSRPGREIFSYCISRPDVREELWFMRGFSLSWVEGPGGGSWGPLRTSHLLGLALQLFGSKDRTWHLSLSPVASGDHSAGGLGAE